MPNRGPRLGILLNGEGMSLAESIHYSVSLEEAGFDSVWHAEVQVEPVVPLAAIAARTSRLHLTACSRLRFVGFEWSGE